MTTQTEERVNGVAQQTKPTIVEVISQVMSEVQAVGKDDRNTQQGYSFRGIDAVINAVGPVFRRHGVVPVPMLENATFRDVQTSTGKPSRECTVQVRYRFYGPAGDYLDAVVPGESMDFGDKGAPKAMSVAYRIVLLQLLAIPTHEPEPDAQSYERDNTQLAPPPPSREQILTRAQQAITGASALTQLPDLTAKVSWEESRGTITTDDAAALMAAIRAREVEMQGNGTPEPAAEAASA